jgi:small redox-active disulfide protein 2
MSDNKKISNEVNIKILGPGCPNCQKLEASAKQAVQELKIEAKIEKISDIAEIMSYNVMNMPVLVIDEKIVFSGSVPGVEEIKNSLSKKDEGCSCGGSC